MGVRNSNNTLMTSGWQKNPTVSLDEERSELLMMSRVFCFTHKSPVQTISTSSFNIMIVSISRCQKDIIQGAPCSLWHYRLWSFKTRDTKLERFLHKNQRTQRKLLNFENWTNGEPQ